MCTKKQLAEGLGVSKSTVYRLIHDQGIKYERKQGQTMLYADSVMNQLEKLLDQSYGGYHGSQNNNDESVSKDKLIDHLRTENHSKADSIRWLQHQLDTKERTLQLTIADNRQLHQQLTLGTTSDTENDHQGKDNGSTRESSKADAKETTSEPKKRHWWQLL